MDRFIVVANGHYRNFNPGEPFAVSRKEYERERKARRPRLELATLDALPEKAQKKIVAAARAAKIPVEEIPAHFAFGSDDEMKSFSRDRAKERKAAAEANNPITDPPKE